MNDRDLRWNRFIDEICGRDTSELNSVQKKAVLCFWYMSEMNSGGHSGYFDCYPDTNPQELFAALVEIGNIDYAENYKKALTEEAEEDEYEATDNAFYDFSPELDQLLMEYVEKNKEHIFD